MDLFLLRHAQALNRAPRGGGDCDRPLSSEGEKRLREVARGLRALGLSFDLILASPYLRARRTAEIVAERVGGAAQVKLTPHLEPEGDLEALLKEVIQHPGRPQSVLVVGHEPYLSRLVSLLVTGRQELQMTFKKAGLCKLTADTLRPGACASLEWLAGPRLLSLLR